MTRRRKKTHVVVGGGTSGAILTRCLIDDGDQVVLIDSGGEIESRRSFTSSSFMTKKLNLHPREDVWTYQCYGENSDILLSNEIPALASRSIAYPRGQGIGGSSNINAMIFYRGHDFIFDQYWPSSWNSNFVKRMEERVLKIIDFNEVETSGNMQKLISSVAAVPQQEEAEIRGDLKHSCRQSEEWCRVKYRSTMDSSRSQRRGLGEVLQGIPSDQLLLRLGVTVTQVVIEGDKAIGVRVISENGKEDIVSPANGGEIILAAGVFGSPSILARSGVLHRQHPDDLVSLDNLQDHAILPYIGIGNWYSGWNIKRPGSASDLFPVNSVHGWIYLDEEGNVWNEQSPFTSPSCQLLFLDGFCAPGLAEMFIPRLARGSSAYQGYLRPLIVALLNWIGRFELVRWLCGFVFGALICSVQPRATGKVVVDRSGRLNSIEPNLLTSNDDRAAVSHALEAARKIFGQFLKRENFWFREVLPGPLPWKFYSSFFSSTHYHPCGTCPMKTPRLEKEDCILDDELRVLGLQGLRVADASSIPHIPTSPIAATCMIIGAAASTFINPKNE
eukprot:gene2102-2299_t